jgi:putative copper resistance protein D
MGIAAGALIGLAVAAVHPVLAHGGASEAPTLGSLPATWSDDPLTLAGLVAGVLAYLVAVRLVNKRHPASPVPRRRVVAWLAGMVALGIALFSAVDVYATDLLTVHMVQHLLLAMVAPPLLALAAPVTLALRVARAPVRRGILLPLLHARISRILSAPISGWIVFTAVMWGTHFSPLFGAALEDPLVHMGEHLLYLGAGLLYWWPIVGADPSPHRAGYGARVVSLGLQMPVHAITGLAIYFAPQVLYSHYLDVERSWGPSPLADQQLAGALMWGAGDILLMIALILSVAVWLQAEERRARRWERRPLARRMARGRASLQHVEGREEE